MTTGFETKAALKKEVKTGTYPGAVIALGADDGIPFLSEGIKKTLVRQVDATLDGKASIKDSDITGEFYAGPLDVGGRYRGLDKILAFAMGFENPQSPTIIEAGKAFKHLYELDEILATQGWLAGEGWLAGGGLIAGDKKVRRGTFGIEKGVSIWEYQSLMFNDFTIKFNVKDDKNTVQLSLNAVAYNQDRASSVNTSSSTWTVPAAPSILMPGECVVRIAPYSAGGLVSGDSIGITEGEIVVEPNLVTDEQTTASGLKIEEPINDGLRAVKGSFKYNRYQNNDNLDRYDSQTLMMMDIKCTGGIIAGATSDPWQFNIYVPEFRFSDVQAPVGGAGRIGVPNSWIAERPSTLSLPTGFPTPIKYSEIFIETQNDLSVNILTVN